MDTLKPQPYIPGTRPAKPGPLARYLPPVEAGVAAAWLADHARPGDWVLDPFGSAPGLAVEAARAGYRLLVAANNPVTRFLLEMAADPPLASELNAALADLAVLRKGDEKLEAHIESLYLTCCAGCGREIPAQAFLWHKDDSAPFARIYKCSGCGDEAEQPATPADLERAERIATMAGWQRARIIERVAALDDPDREHAVEALQYYLPRAIYALGKLFNRLDGLSLSPERRSHLIALLLTACDAANTLWQYPAERPRPRQLIVPAQFRENNVWMAMENGIGVWTDGASAVTLSVWPQKLPETGGICIFEGRLKELSPYIKEAPVKAVLTTLPRPNQAFWTLSALWAGWLWGHEAVAPFKHVLRRRRYDWNWHATALQAAFGHLYELLSVGVPVLGLLAEPEPPFLSAALSAAEASGFELLGLAARTADDPIQIQWQRRSILRKPDSRPDLKLVQKAVNDYLISRAEPAVYLHLHAVCLAELVRQGALVQVRQPLDEALPKIHATIQEVLKGDDLLRRYDGSEHSLDVGLWGLKTGVQHDEPLSDRVEMALVRFLQSNPPCPLMDTERVLYPQFPGLLTPPKSLVGAVLESYGVAEKGQWRLRDEDIPSARQTDLKEMVGLIESIGRRLDYKTKRREQNVLLWLDDSKPAYTFFLLTSAVIGRLLTENPAPREQNLIVLPGGRAGLLAYKQRRDPFLWQNVQGWRFVKFRLLRALGNIPILTRQTWQEQIDSDPIEQSPEQMMMF
ncbi:MAG: hypothetical protein MUP03_06960 [Anaerolineales bacterium]|nr:hypothetical protein [Anaerolineales bacterium]